jgi:hypothetical protein
MEEILSRSEEWVRPDAECHYRRGPRHSKALPDSVCRHAQERAGVPAGREVFDQCRPQISIDKYRDRQETEAPLSWASSASRGAGHEKSILCNRVAGIRL